MASGPTLSGGIASEAGTRSSDTGQRGRLGFMPRLHADAATAGGPTSRKRIARLTRSL